MLSHSNELDAFVGLTRGPAWQIDYFAGDDAAVSKVPRFGSGQFAAITGMPHIFERIKLGVSLDVGAMHGSRFLGPATNAGIPGDVHPKIAVGGVENPAGIDYGIAPQEVPHLRSQVQEECGSNG